MVQALVFLVVAFSVVGLLHYYLWRKLVRSTTSNRRSRRIGTWLTIGVSALVVITFVGEDALPPGYAKVLAWPGYIWIAVMFYLFVGLVLLEVPALVGRILIRRSARTSAPTREPALVGAGAGGDNTAGRDEGGASSDGLALVAGSRRLFLARAVAVTAGVASVGLVGTGVGSALGSPQIKRIQVPLARLSRGADGMRIALVSDIHLGPLRGIEHISRIVSMINGLDADAVAIVGDLVDGSVDDLGPAAEPLRDLRSRHGAYFVTGNHEYFSGYEQWVEFLPQLGLLLLRNERVELPGGIDIAGVNDLNGAMFGDGPRVAETMAGRDPSRAVVLLAHQPVLAAEAAQHGVDLQLSGHTHGGQMVPFNLIVKASGQPVISGMGVVDGMPVYVTNGAGFWGPPVRIGAPPDITLVELRTG